MNLFFRSTFIGFVFFVLPSLTVGAENQDLLRQADSLYQAKKYTEAFQHYQELFDQNQGSAAMLARMAFIKEGLGDYSNALYYLSLYYNQTSDKKVLSKMRELAEKHQLSGYEYSDGAFIAGVAKKYKYELLLFLFFFSLILTFYIYRKKKHKEQPVTSAVFQIVTIIFAMLLINNAFFQDYGIVSQGNALLMSGPSAGAEPVEIIDKGHKLKLLEADEVWSKVIWNDQEVFIRSKNLKRI
ncbi:MAG: SH3 domain-containing protein [Cyclobacteriaceae bacterium]